MSFSGSAGGARRVGATVLRHRMISAVAGTAAAVIVAGCAFAVSAQDTGSEKTANTGNSRPAKPTAAPVAPLRLLSVSPAGGSRHANGGAPVTLTFSSALSPGTPLPVLTPKIAGSWKVAGKTAVFTPASGFLPGTKVTVQVPGGAAGMAGAAAAAGTLAQPARVTFTAGAYSVAGLQVSGR